MTGRQFLASIVVMTAVTAVGLPGAEESKQPFGDDKLQEARWQKVLPGAVAEAEVKQIRAG
jgi:hypothetical protein